MAYAPLVHQWFDKVWCLPPCDASINELMTEDAQLNGIRTTPVSREEFRAIRNHLLDQFPDIKITVTHTLEQGDTVAFHATVTGSHRKSGAPFQFGGTGLVRFADNHIVESRETWDMLGLLAQIGEVNQEAIPEVLGIQ
ncbi:ester cyclase [Acanthopleuribacter pedis]|uniref:Ester cyclase n=1 Tax=Acanthopleuribacter pedis TaxID=442870 RepID=A0A8J7Q8L8_9BACT|nr:ester cyclase [Acanthopleuribacter pedis]MBO1319722.1 ester cyclase [Acanthopleuribacter pedis]